jgi:hypothetical protein
VYTRDPAERREHRPGGGPGEYCLYHLEGVECEPDDYVIFLKLKK